MKLIISGYYGFGNAGDEAILYSIIEGFQSHDKNIDFIVLSNQPERTKKELNVDAVNRWNYKKIWEALKISDGLISGGGSLLQDETGWKSVPYYTGIMAMAWFQRKPFIVFSQGIGPIRHAYNRRLAAFIISKARYISVRDEASKKTLRQMGIKQKIDVIPDPVLAMGGHFSPEIDEEKNRKTIAVSIRQWPSQQDYLDKIVRVLQKCEAMGYSVVFVPMHEGEDFTISLQAAERLSDSATVISPTLTFRNKMAIIQKCGVVLGMRLHALIFAAAGGIPYVALSYDPKVEAMAKLCHQPLIGTVHDHWREDQLLELLVEQMEKRDEVKKELQTILAPLTDQYDAAVRNAINAIL